jgi:ubiquinone/menaquinone biosynthesis C-methylase UbiE
MNVTTEDLERDNLEKYNGNVYHADTITRLPSKDSKVHADIVLRIRLDLVTQYADQATVLDLCCGTGEHLLSLANHIKQGVGFDYSTPFIEKANRTRTAFGTKNIKFIQGNARKMPFKDGRFDLVYSFSSLYYIPNVGEVINEIARVLKSHGKCVLDLGNVYSLNTIVCRAYPELAHLFTISVPMMKRLFHEAGLVIVEHRPFQILPLWADRPKWLKPLLWAGWAQLLARQIKGKILDEWISNLPVLKCLAFRHVYVCEKR